MQSCVQGHEQFILSFLFFFLIVSVTSSVGLGIVLSALEIWGNRESNQTKRTTLDKQDAGGKGEGREGFSGKGALDLES